MKLSYCPQFEVSKQIESLNRRRNELNFLLGVFTEEMLYKHPSPSLVTGKEIERCAKSLLKGCKNDFSALDSIIMQDIRANAKKAVVTHDYFFSKKIEKVSGFLSGIFGNGAYSEITTAISPQKLDHQAIHDFFSLMRKRTAGTIDSELIFDEDEFRSEKKRVTKIIEGYRGHAEQFLKHLDIAQKMPDYTLVSSPYDFSFWDFGAKVMAIERDLVPCIRAPGGKFVFLKSLGLSTAIHEAVHLVHEEVSRQCLPAVYCEPESYENLVQGACVEGVALFSENIALEWIRKESESLGVENELELLAAFKNAYLPNKMMRIAACILEIKEAQERAKERMPEHFKTESDKELARITEFYGFGKERYIFPQQTLVETVFMANYFFGSKKISNIACKAKRKFRLNLNSSATKGLLLQALMTGMWASPEAQEKFVIKHFFPKAKQDKII